MKIKRIDADGKRIVHGRDYIFNPSHPYMISVIGKIYWNKDILTYIFVPKTDAWPVVIVAFGVSIDNERIVTMQASDYTRYKP